MDIDVGKISAWIGVITAVATPMVMLLKRLSALIKRLDVLERWNSKQQKDIEISKQERRILIEGTLACLEGLKEQGCNGAVSEAIQDIRDFMIEASHAQKKY